MVYLFIAVAGIDCMSRRSTLSGDVLVFRELD